MDYSKLDGLIPAVVQDDRTGEVLMVGFMNDEALRKTRETGFATFFSRTRGALWTKGETSGNRLEVKRTASRATRASDPAFIESLDTQLIRVASGFSRKKDG
jgi:phosphoribosyl-AMP cyclohydrolase